MTELKPSSASDKKVFFICFIIVNLFLATFYVDTWCTPNPVSRALPVLTLLDSGTFKIDRYKNHTSDISKVGDHYYSDKAPFPSMVAVPFYWLLRKTGLTKTTETTGKKYPIYIWSSVTQADGRDFQFPDIIPLLIMGGILISSIPFVIMIFLSLKKIEGAEGSIPPVALVMMSFYGSFMFVFSGTFFNHILTGFLLLMGYILIKDKKYLLAGLFTGLSFICESPVAVAIPLWALVIWLREKNFKNIVLFGLGVLPSAVFICLFNYSISGHPFTMINAYSTDAVFQNLQHNYGFSLPTFQSLWGLSFSAYMGLLWHAPVLFLCAYFVVKELINKYPFKSLLSNYLAMFSIPFFLLIAASFAWWGGWSYGPRYLMCLAFILVYEGIIYLSDKKLNMLLFLAVTGFGLISTWLAKVTLMYMIPDGTSQQGPAHGQDSFKNFILPQFNKGHFNASNIFTLGFDVSASTAAYLWLFLFIGTTVAFSLWYRKLYPAPVIQKVQVKVKPKKGK